MQQHSPEWYEIRIGKFTSSEIYKLIPNGRRDMTDTEIKSAIESKIKRRTVDTPFGEGGISYIRDKIHEELTKGTSLDYSFQGNKATDWGEQFESEARNAYSLQTGLLVEECGFLTSDFCKMYGGSPDGLVSDDGIIEIKCPYGSAHAIHLTYIDVNEFAENEKEYYAQIQSNLLVSGRKWADFVSYDPRYQNEIFKLKIIRIERDEPFISLLKSKVEMAELYFSQMLDKIINTKILNHVSK